MSRVLITDDSQLTRRILRAILEASGHEVMEASNGNVALELIVQVAPDCVLLDLLMPGMDGFEVLSTLNERGIDIPVIVLTADIQETARKKCIQMGAVDFLNKPPNDDELQAAMEKALALKEEKLP
jgi:CheY-like chemotaxis protein